jgi:hypothetical protein
MRTYYQGTQYTVEFDENDTTCFVRHTDASPQVVQGRGAFVFDTVSGELVAKRGAARGRKDQEWLAFSMDAQDHAREELRRHGVLANPYGFGCDIPEIANPKKGGEAEIGRIVVMGNPGQCPTRVRPGEEGYIANVDDDGVIYVEWSGGESSSLAADDTFELPTAWNPEPARISRTRGVKTMRGPYSARKGYKPWITRRGKLGEGFLTTMSKKQREASLDRCVDAYGYRSCLGSIMVLERAKRGPRGQGEGIGIRYAKKLAASRDYLKQKYGGVGSFGPREKAKPARRAAESGPGYDTSDVAIANPVHRLLVTAPNESTAAARGRRFGRVMEVKNIGGGQWHVTVNQRRVAPNPSNLSEISLTEVKIDVDPEQEILLDRLVMAARNDGDAYRLKDPDVAVDSAFATIMAQEPERLQHDFGVVRGEAVRLVRKRWRTKNPCPNPCFGLHVHGEQVGPVLQQIQGRRPAANPGTEEHARRAHAYLREGQDVMRRAMEHAYARDAHRFALLAGHEVDDSKMKGSDAKHFHEAVAQLASAATALLDDLKCRWGG